MKWKNKPFLIKVLVVSLLVTQISLSVVKAPSYTNGVSISSGIEFRAQHAEREFIHDCDDSTGWTNLTVLDYTFSTDTENYTQGTASVKTIINFGVVGTAAFRSNTGLGIDVSDKDYVDWWIRTNDTIAAYFFVLYDSSGYNLYWNFPVSVNHASFTLYELSLANPTFEHASFDRTDISFIMFQCNGVGFTTVWTDYVSTSVWQHFYVPQAPDSYYNITLDDGVLGLSKSVNAFDIECETEDRVTTEIHSWFTRYVTRLRPYSLNSSSFTFDITSCTYGEPQAISGVSSWSYEESTTTVTFSCSNYSMVTIRFEDLGTRQLVWYLDRIPMFLGISGMFMMMLAPIMFVVFIKKDEWQTACVWGLMSFVIGMGLLIGWLW